MTATATGLRYGIDSYADWLAGEGIPVHQGVALNLFELDDRGLAALRLQGRVHEVHRRRRLLLDVRPRHPGGRLDVTAAASCRRDLLRARRPRLDADRARRRLEAQLRVGPAQLLRDPAQRQAPPLQRQRDPAGAHVRDDDAADDAQALPRRQVRLQHAVRIRIADREDRVLRRRGQPAHRPSRQQHVGDELRPRPRRDRAAAVGRARHRLDQHHLRARRRDHARAHLGDRAGDVQEGAPAQRGDARPHAHRRRLLAALVRGQARLRARRLELRRGLPAVRAAVPPALRHREPSLALRRDRTSAGCAIRSPSSTAASASA